MAASIPGSVLFLFWLLLAIIGISSTAHGRDFPSADQLQPLVLPSAAVDADDALSLPAELTEPGLLWEKCRDVRNIGEVCIGIYGDPTAVPSTLGVQLRFMNSTFNLPVVGAQTCLDDKLLLRLLAKNPKFAAFAEMIEAIIVAEELSGAEVLSECVVLTDFLISLDESGDSVFLDGCPILRSRWGCFKNRCLKASEKQFECFHIVIPKRRKEAV
eukprot:TRINITY_DN14826_c0_g2_i2.p1 TRINITY_DN14826_c0_g2~~TRINITY_DN14826_c0_g2_i2.p1  ORF type:complete len:215 (-),score=35.42 TRINITY_DN14826_c0_g2_i2:272-916(-)